MDQQLSSTDRALFVLLHEAQGGGGVYICGPGLHLLINVVSAHIDVALSPFNHSPHTRTASADDPRRANRPICSRCTRFFGDR